MKRSKLKKSRNLVIKVNMKVKLHYFNNMVTEKKSRFFWNEFKPYLSNKQAQGESNITLPLLTKNDQIAHIF